MSDVRKMKMDIVDKVSLFIPELIKGKHIEIHMSQNDCVKVFVVDKKIIK